MEFIMIYRHIEEVDESTLSKASAARLKRTRDKYLNKQLFKISIIDIRYVRANRQPQAVAKFICACGNTGETFLTLISNKKTVSCGCWNALKQQKPTGIGAARACFSSRKADAKRRQLQWTLSFKEYHRITQQNCFYCNKLPSNEYGSDNYNGNFFYSGLDRVNNLLGYSKQNCVPCCKECNHAKGMMTMVEFKQHITKIYLNFIINNKELGFGL
jgi:hypothetical protein